MNDKDKESFEKWLKDFEEKLKSKKSSPFDNGPLTPYGWSSLAWQNACEYKQKEIDELIKQLKHEHDLYKKHLKIYEVENAKLRECVEFYADIISWDKCGGERIRIKDDDIYLMNNLLFGGKRARQVLKELNNADRVIN